MGQQARLIPRAGLIVRHAHMRPRVRALPTLHHAADLDGWIATNPRSGAGKWPALALAPFFFVHLLSKGAKARLVVFQVATADGLAQINWFMPCSECQRTQLQNWALRPIVI
jgi:hypothetical protein